MYERIACHPITIYKIYNRNISLRVTPPVIPPVTPPCFVTPPSVRSVTGFADQYARAHARVGNLADLPRLITSTFSRVLGRSVDASKPGDPLMRCQHMPLSKIDEK